MLTYTKSGTSTYVYLSDGPNTRTVCVGEIIKCKGGYQYHPKGIHIPGDVFKSIKKCKQSLEIE